MIKIRLSILLFIVLNWTLPAVFAAFDSATFNALTPSKPLELLRITPEGEDVATTKQIVFQFNQPVVPVGRMERNAGEIPITITPAVACEWRWLNTSALACQLGDETALKLATRYQVEVQTGILTESQVSLKSPYSHYFITQRPTISYTHFMTWRAPGMPVIRVSFDQPVTPQSVKEHLYLQKPDGQRITLKIEVAPPEEEEVNESDESGETETDQTPVEEEIEVTKPIATLQPLPESATAWLVYPEKLLSLDTAMKLVVEPGIVSTLGTEAGIENRVAVEFHTFPEFKFLGVQCTTLEDEQIVTAPQEKWAHRCNPLRQISLLFSSPVIKEVLKDNLVVIPDLTGGRTDYDPWEKVQSYSHLNDSHEKDETYGVWLPELLKAHHIYQLKADALNFKDEFGRSLTIPIDIAFATDHRAPDRVFEHNISVLEQGVDSEVPMYITNLKEISLNYHTLTNSGWSDAQRKALTFPAVNDVSFKIPLGIRELLGNKNGVVQGQMEIVPFLKEYDYANANWFFSQVTPFHVQAKLGHHNTLVWVTSFATGLPVSGVEVSIYQDTYAVKPKLPDTIAHATTDNNGIAILPGSAELDPQLKYINRYNNDEPRFFVRCQQGEDFALLPLDYEFQVSMYDVVEDSDGFYPSMQPKYGHIHTWGTTAQGIYKVGDTVQYKFFVRNQDNNAFTTPPSENYQLRVIDPMGKVAHEVKELTLSEFGGYNGEFTVAKNGAVGWYRFELKKKFGENEKTWQPMRVLVSDFTPSPFRVNTLLKSKLFHVGENVTVETTATLHAGGPYVNAPTRVTAMLSQQPLMPSHPQAKGFQFDVNVDEASDDTVHQSEDKIDDQGQLQTTFTLPSSSAVLYGKLTIESAVKDDRGKNVANSTTAQYVGRDRFVGLKQTQWLLEAGKSAQVQMLVVDEFGNPVTMNTEIRAKIERLETKAARVKGAGNAYLTQYQHEWVESSTCQTVFNSTPVTCDFVPPKAGTYKIVASIKDTQGRDHSTELQQWATGSDWITWETSPTNALKVVPEQKSYKVGENARYLVQNPFPGAQALITVERFGVIKSWVKPLNQSIEIVEIPVEADFVPGFFVSIVVMSPRVDKPIDENQVDLGKPAFRMGYVKTMVEDPYKELMVDIKSDKPTYKPREQVTVDLQVRARQPDVKPQPLELTVVVLDESVFDLLTDGRNYFDPYKGFYTLDDLDMANYSLLMRLVGRQKFEKKGADPGGDGGMSLAMRSLFKFVSYWNPSLKTDEEGKARIQFTVPDNLTGWRVLAMAMTPTDRMGLGDGNFKVNQPIEIRPVLPNQVVSGDRFQAGFTIMNRTDKVRELKVNVQAAGPVELMPCPPTLAQCGANQTLKVEPYKRHHVWLPLKTTKEGEIEFKVTAGDAEEQDGLTKTLTVLKRRSLDTAATYGTTVQNEVTESILFPSAIYPDTGGLQVTATPSIIGGIEGAFEYMRDYPYVCWEQKLSKGVMAAHYQNLQAYLPASLVWSDSQTLPKQTLELATEYQASNGGMTFYQPQDQYVSPYLSAYTALAFNWLRESQLPVPDAVENKLHDYLLKMLSQDVMPKFYSEGMVSSVRAVALAALAKHGKVTVADLKRYQLHVKGMDLFGKAQYLQAAVRVPKTESIQRRAVNMILGSADQTSGKIIFTETLEDGYRQMLSSSLRTKCAILSSLLEYDELLSKNSKKQSPVGDIPFKLVQAITQARKNRGHWENTQENLFCMNALTEYSRIYEKDTPAMTIRSWLDSEPLPVLDSSSPEKNEKKLEAAFADVKDAPATFVHSMTTADPGRKATVKLEREGQGRVYYVVRMNYASTEEQAKAVNSGIEMNREYHVERTGKWELLNSPMTLKTGELVRVDLYLSLPAPRHFVVVDDPVPGGLEPVNRDLATASKVDADKANGQYVGGSLWFRFNNWREFSASIWNFYHQELRHDAVRFYSDYLPAGNYHLSYTAQAIAPGQFRVLPTHTEEMYNPEVYGKSLPAILEVMKTDD